MIGWHYDLGKADFLEAPNEFCCSSPFLVCLLLLFCSMAWRGRLHRCGQVIRAEGAKIVRNLMRLAGKARKGVEAAVGGQPWNLPCYLTPTAKGRARIG